MRAFILAALLSVCIILTGCGPSQQEYDKLKQENDSLSQKNASLEQEVGSLNQQLTSITAERNEFKSKYEQVSQKRDKLTTRVADLEGKLNNARKEAQVATKAAKEAQEAKQASSYTPQEYVFDHFGELLRNSQQYVGRTVTLYGKQYCESRKDDGYFLIQDNARNMVNVYANSDKWRTYEGDYIRATGTYCIDADGYFSKGALKNCSLVECRVSK